MKKILADRKKYLGFDDILFMLICVPVTGILMSFLFFDGLDHGWEYLRFRCLETAMHTAVYWLLLTSFMVYLRKKYNHIEHTARRIIIQSVVFILLGLVVSPFLHLSLIHI